MKEAMARRIVVSAALIAALVVAAGWIAWQSRVNAVRSSFDSTVALARVLVAATSSAESLERALAAPDLHVAVEDRNAGYVYEWENGKPVPHQLPPVPPGAPPPDMQPQGPPPPQGPQGPPGPRRPAPRTPLSQIAGLAVGRAPVRIPDDAIAVIIAPGVDALGTYLLFDAILTVLALVITLGGATRIVSGLARAERKRLENTLEERHAAAKEFQRFLADAGHELRTPLTIVSGYVEILSAELERSERGAQILEGLRAETARMRALVEKMLLLARLESPISVPRLVDVGSVAADVVTQMQARFPERDVILRASERASIVIDQDDLYEALRNLVENALRYAPSSPVEIDVAPAENNASIAVTDHGVGIAPEECGKIFDRFYRGSAQTDAEGSGLGLAIVSRVAARWNGAVRVQSKPGTTMFTLQFPLADEVYGT